MGNPYPVSITDTEGEARLTGFADFTDSGNQPAAGFTGWTEDASNPANVSTNGGNLLLGDTGQAVADDGAGTTASVAAGAFSVVAPDQTYEIGSGFGVLSSAAPGLPCFTADNTNGATVAVDAGGLLVTNCGPIQIAAGVPSGAPTSLPFAFDSTAVTGGLYVWNGTVWVQVSVTP